MGMATYKERGAMAWGKIRRLILIYLRPKTAAKDLAQRQGSCNNCGACCQILFKCPAFKPTDDGGWCTVYHNRPGVCALFPINQKDLHDRDIVMPDKACGFYFTKEPNGLFKPVQGKPDLSLVKEPLHKLRSHPNRKPIVKRTLAIVLSKFQKKSA